MAADEVVEVERARRFELMDDANRVRAVTGSARHADGVEIFDTALCDLVGAPVLSWRVRQDGSAEVRCEDTESTHDVD